MNNRLVIEFPSVVMMNYFIGQMSDGYGENFCNFSTMKQKPDTSGKFSIDYEEVIDKEGNLVCFVSWVDGCTEEDKDE